MRGVAGFLKRGCKALESSTPRTSGIASPSHAAPRPAASSASALSEVEVRFRVGVGVGA